MILKNGKRLDGMGDSMPIGSVVEYNGTDIPDGWEILPGDANVYIGTTEPTEGQEIWVQPKSKNLVSGFRNNQTFNVDTNNYQDDPYGFSVTDFIPVEVGETYIFSHHLNHWCGGVHLFNQHHNFLGTINADQMYDPIVISNPHCKFIIIYTWDPNNNTTVNETWMQLEVGTTVTEYEPYHDGKIYIKDNKKTYNLFYDEANKETVSVNETRVGTWITGQPLYSKLIYCGGHPGDGVEINIPINIPNFDYLQKLEAAGTYASIYFLPLPYISADGTQKCQVFFKGGTFNTIGINSNIKLSSIIVTLYYTKKID